MNLFSFLLIGSLMLASPVTGQTTAENDNLSGQHGNEQVGEEHAGDRKSITFSDDERNTLAWTGLGFGVFVVIWTVVIGCIVWKRETFGEGQVLVVTFFTMFFLLIMFSTAAAWVVDGILPHEQNGHHLYEIFADGFQVTLGALIGVLTMWSRRSLRDETAR